MQLEIFDVKKNIDDYSAESYTGIYGVHKYWSKKPYNIIRHFIEKYSRVEEIVLDPFCGSGISIIESVLSNRKAVGFDINPSAIFITKQMLNKISTSKLYESYLKIESKVKDDINSLYVIERESKKYLATHFIWEENELTEIWYQNGSNKNITKPTESDIIFINQFDYDKINYYYPRNDFFHNPRINAYGGKKIYELFTPRNLFALSMLMNAIGQEDDPEIRDILKFCFTSCVGQASKMVFVVKNRGKYKGQSNETRKEVGSWVIGYWTPKENFEINVWNCFNNKFQKIIKAKKQQEKSDYEVKEVDDISFLTSNDKNLYLRNLPAQKALKEIPDNSIDYVITDPPHGNRIPYLELSMLWNSWLKMDVDYESEIVISESKERKKNLENYNSLLNKVFQEIYRVLKYEKFFSLMFNSLDDNTWINVISELHTLNFQLHKVETLDYSANSVVQDTRGKGLKTDFILTFVKRKNHLNLPLNIISIEKETIINLIEVLSVNSIDKSVRHYQIFNQLFKYYLNQNKFFKISEAIKIIDNKIITHQN
ncbi:MAG: DNA methylase [Ignavibacteriales bacterium]|nr:MAG: DNA methylase [Ignavibacteriales bacterium]